jgi:5'-nucleotidase
MRRPRRAISALAATALAAGLVAVAAPPAHAADIRTINLLNINDFHGRIDSNTVKVAGTIEQLRAASGEASTLLLSAGDNIGASLFASASQDDLPTIDVLNALELQSTALGNHEFDRGRDLLGSLIEPRAAFPFLGANVYLKGTTTPAFDEFSLATVNGVTVGVIGVVTQETPSLVSPGGIATLDFGDPVAAVNRVADELTDGDVANGEADVIVAQYHEGAQGGGPLATEVAASPVFARIVNETSPKVDAIFNGHTHQTYAYSAPVPGGGTRPVVQTGSYGANIGQVVLSYDADTDTVASFTAANVARTATADATLISAYPRVAAVSTIVTAALNEAAVVGGKPIGSVTADITTAYIGAARDDRASESTLGGLVADSLVASLSDPLIGGAEIGVVNPGGLRNELLYSPDGVITFAEANAVLPFVNNLWTTTLTGAQFKTLLEQQWQRDANGNVPSRSYLQLGLSSNVSYTFDPARPEGDRITSIRVDGAPIDPARGYRVGAFSFLVQGGDNFHVMKQGTGVRDSGLIDRDAWIAYLGANSPVSPSFARRSVQVSGAPSTPVLTSDLVSFTVSKLDLTSLGSPANTVLTATSGGEELGSFAVTAGAATVSFTVPDSWVGPREIVLTASPSGTTTVVPITVAQRPLTPATPSISGTAVYGQVLSAVVDPWGPAPVALSYQWLRNGEPIPGATGTTYRAGVDDVGTALSVSVTGSRPGYATETRTSAPVAVAPASLTRTPQPVILGKAKVGSTLYAYAGSWRPYPVALSYQWLRNGEPIPGATSWRYTPRRGDRGDRLSVAVTGSKPGYASVTRISEPTSRVR